MDDQLLCQAELLSHWEEHAAPYGPVRVYRCRETGAACVISGQNQDKALLELMCQACPKSCKTSRSMS